MDYLKRSALAHTVLAALYRIEVKDADNTPQPGDRAVVVVNHVSLLNGLPLAASLPGMPTFAIHSRIAQTR